MNKIVSFPRSVDAPIAPLPEGVAAHFARSLEVIETMAGFLDRIDYAAQTITECQTLLFAQVIDLAQFTGMVTDIRDLLASYLGEIGPAR